MKIFAAAAKHFRARGEKLGNHDQQTDGGGEQGFSCSDGSFGSLCFRLLIGMVSVFPHSWLEVHGFKLQCHLKKRETGERKERENESLKKSKHLKW